MTVMVFSHQSGVAHDPGPGHPEAPVRLRTLLAELERAALPGVVMREAPQASIGLVERAHPRDHVETILQPVAAGARRRLDPDTVMNEASAEAALRAAGGACAAVDAVMAGEAEAGFVAMRPPGHHAETATAMGFCLFNTVAIAALHARHAHGLSRLAIVDFDVHHGNGTQAIFWDDPDTLYVSSHQSPLYPGTGAAFERGIKGNILNRPLPPGTDGAAFRAVATADLLPAIELFRPEFVFISAGFDAHATDPLGGLRLMEEDFAWITGELMAVARRHARGRVVSVLEGGYNPPALASSVIAHLVALGAGEAQTDGAGADRRE